jgi:hypothetical protein
MKGDAHEATAVLSRLVRIEALEQAGAPAKTILAELRGLLAEAEAWARLEGGERGAQAVDRLREALAGDMIPG